MKTFKRFLSCFLALTMVLGMFSGMGAMFAVNASAAEAVSQVESYEDLKSQYTDFIYYGIDVMEVAADGAETLTDFYVNAGDTLNIYHYVKSTRYVTTIEVYLEFSSDFFDVTAGTGKYLTAEPNAVNTEHSTSAQGLYFDLTTSDIFEPQIYASIGYTGDTSKIDSMHLLGGTDRTKGDIAGLVTEDKYLTKTTVKVKDGLADGATGTISSTKDLWVISDFNNENLRYDIFHTSYTVDSTAQEDTGYWDADMSYLLDNPVAEDKFILDVDRTFTIGKAPGQGGTVVLPKAIFVENNGTEISSTPYEEGAAVAIPEAVENQIGWANIATGAVVESLEGYTMPARTVTFQRVLSTDEFDITLDADGAEFETLPEGVTDNGDGTLTIKAGIGEKVSLDNITAEKTGVTGLLSLDNITAEKTGYTGKWNPAEITLDNIKGAKAKVEWKAKTYNLKFYATKGDEASVVNVEATYDEYVDVPTVTKDGFNFVEWKSVGDDSTADFEEPYTVDGDSAYYAKWSECDSSIKFMAMDYATGEWKEYKNFHGNKGETLAKNELTAMINNIKANPEALGWDGEFDITNSLAFSSEIGAGYFAAKDLTYDGESTYYINTKVKFNVEWNIPVFDEEANDYGTMVKTETATVTSGFNTLTVKTTLATDKYAPVEGFALKAWNTADGAAATNWTEANKGVEFTLNAKDGADQSYTAVYGAAEYKVTFAIQDIPNSIYTLTTTVSVGDTLSLKGARVIANGAEKDLIAVGTVVVNEVSGKEGYKLIGWKLGSKLVEFPLEITLDFVKNNVKNGTLALVAEYEAQAYDATFEYLDADGNTVSFKVSGIAVGTLFEKFAPNAEKIAEINAAAPEGKVFDYWSNAEEMIAGGRTFTAVYRPVFYNAYIDYGNGKVDAEGNKYEERLLCEAYGADAWRDGAEDNDPGIAHTVVNGTSWGENNMPGKNYLPTGWEVYHLDKNASLDDESTWKPGINDEGTGEVKSDLVFRATWKQYNEFLFRVMDTSNKTYCALGKNFKMYYFRNGRSADKSDAVLNEKDSTIIVFFKPVLENFVFKEFFNKDMWSQVCLRFDPIELPKSMFTIGGMTGLFRAAFDAIVNAIKGV